MSGNEEKLWNADYLKIWTLNFLVHFSFTLIVPLLPLYLTSTYGASRDTVGMVLAGYSVVSLLIRPFSGYVVDTFPRKTVLMVCCFCFVGLFAGYLAAGSLVVFAIFRTLHGAPFGAVTVATSTVAIDVLPSSRRGEGIGYYGLSSNLASALGPVLAIFLLSAFHNNFQALFMISLAISVAGLILGSTVHLPKRDFVPDKRVISFDRFFLVKGWREGLGAMCLAFSYGVVSTYVVIYGREMLGIKDGAGLFFTLCAVGLVISRLTGAHALRDNRVSRNAMMGMLVSLCAYLIFAAFQTKTCYYLAGFIIGLGNGHMYPAFQTMFINLAEHSQRGTANSTLSTSWDTGVGLGTFAGGIAAEMAGYSAAFWMAFAINAAGVIFYFASIHNHFESNKLR